VRGSVSDPALLVASDDAFKTSVDAFQALIVAIAQDGPASATADAVPANFPIE
jgi:hypothetical protein